MLVSPDPDAVSSVDALEEQVSVVTTTTRPPTTRPTQGPTTEDAVDDAAAGEAPVFAPAGLAGIPVLELDAVGDLVDSIEAGEDPTLHYLHLLMPHAPYHFLPSGQTYDPDARLAGGMSEITGTRSTDPHGADLDRQRLVLQAMYTDRVVGDVLDRLEETGLDEDTIVVVVADHGVGLQPGATPRPTTTENMTEDAYADMLPVPMLVRGPGIEAGAVNDENVQTIDLMPTLAALLGIDIPWSVDGIAVTNERRPDDQKRFHLVSFDGGPIGPTEVGPATAFDGAEVFAEALERNVDTLFLADNPDHRIYDIDEAGELVGARVDGVTARPPSSLSVTLDDPEALAGVDPPSGVLRTHLVGRRGRARPRRPDHRRHRPERADRRRRHDLARRRRRPPPGGHARARLPPGRREPAPLLPGRRPRGSTGPVPDHRRRLNPPGTAVDPPTVGDQTLAQ